MSIQPNTNSGEIYTGPTPDRRIEIFTQENAERLATQAHLGAMHLTMGLNGSNGEAWRRGCEHFQEVEHIANTPRTKEEWKARVAAVLTPEKLEALKMPAGNLTLHTDAGATVAIGGRLYEEGGPDERKYLQNIMQRLEKTLSIANTGDERSAGGVGAYIEYYSKIASYEVDRSKLEEDLRWLMDSKRIGEYVPPDRKKVFVAYRDILKELVFLNSPENERRFVGRHKSVVGDRNKLETYCRDPEAMAGAGKFALLIGASALLALWSIKDFKAGKISYATMLFLGAVIYLMQNGSKFNFLGSSQFARLTEGKLDEKAVAKLQNLARGKPSAYRHLESTMEDLLRADATRDMPVGEYLVRQLTHPTKTQRQNGKDVEAPDPSRAVPLDIAQLFVGMSPGDVPYILKSIRETARSRDSGIVRQFAGAMHGSNGAVRRDLEVMQRVPTFVETFEPVTEEEMRRAAELAEQRQRIEADAARRAPKPKPPSS